jgi:hypothetical protein
MAAQAVSEQVTKLNVESQEQVVVLSSGTSRFETLSSDSRTRIEAGAVDERYPSVTRPGQVEVLQTLREEIGQISASQPSTTGSSYTSWKSRTRSALASALGETHHITESFIALKWTPSTYTMGDPGPFIARFRSAAGQAQGYLEAAIAELEQSPASNALDSAGVDPELWAFVRADIEGEHWGKTATQATLFLEDRLRKWAGQPAELVGVDLMKAVLGPGAGYRLGRTEGEKDGWHQFARGITLALRNAAAHRIEDRPDHRRYVLGVVGACSLLLTQLRYEHGNRFDDLSPVSMAGEGTVMPNGDAPHLRLSEGK